MTDTIKIIVREDGSREVAKRIAEVGVAASKSAEAVAGMQKSLSAQAALGGKASKALQGQATAQNAVAVAQGKAAVAATKAGSANKKLSDRVKSAKTDNEQLSFSIRNLAQAYGILDGPLGPVAGRLSSVSSALKSLSPLLVVTGIAVAGLAAGLVSVVTVGARAEQLVTRITAVVKATGGAAGKTTQDITRLAQSVSAGTLASVEGVREASAVLLTFRSISGETFDRTINLAQDLASVFGGTLTDATLQLAKALEDPTVGLNALRRNGVTFSQDQQDVIKALYETGNALGAQKVILDEVAKQVGGVAIAEGGNTVVGAFDNIGDALENLYETIANKTGVLEGVADTFNTIAYAIDGANILLNRFTGELNELPEQKVDSFFSKMVDRMAEAAVILGNIQPGFAGLTGFLATSSATGKAAAPKPVAELSLLYQQSNLIKEIQASGTAAGEILKQRVFGAKSIGDLDLIKAQVKSLDDLKKVGVTSGKAFTDVVNATTAVLAQSAGVQGVKQAEAEKALQATLKGIVTEGTKDRIAAQADLENDAATSRVATAATDRQKLVNDLQGQALSLQADAQQEAFQARLEVIKAGVGREYSVISQSLDEQIRLQQESGSKTVQAIEAQAKIKLDAVVGTLQRETQLVTQELAVQNTAIEKANREQQLAASLNQTIDGATQPERVKAEQQILALNTKLLGIKKQIAAAVSQVDQERINELNSANLQTEGAILALKQQQQALRIQEATTLRSIVDSSKTQTEILEDQIKILKGMVDSQAAIDAGVNSDEFARSFAVLNARLETELQKQDTIIHTFSQGAAQTLQSTFADFLFNPFANGLRGMAVQFADAIRRMAVDAAAAQIFEKLFGGTSADGLPTKGKFGAGGLASIIQGKLDPVSPDAAGKSKGNVGNALDVLSQRGQTVATPLYVQNVPGAFGFGGGGGGGGGAGGGAADDLAKTLAGSQEQVNTGFIASLKGVFDNAQTGFGALFQSLIGLFSGGGGGSTGGTIAGIFGAVASAYAGGAAHGGTFGAGQFGLVGENGPELISAGTGPVRITPMPKGGGNSSQGMNSQLAQLIAITEAKNTTVVNVNEQDPQALIAVMRTRTGVAENRNFVNADKRKISRTLGIR